MREPYTQLYLHVVWATWDRLPLLTPGLIQPIYPCIQPECGELGCQSIAIGGVEDHVHLLVRFPGTIPVAHMVKPAKGSSSHLVTHQLAPDSGFKWQDYYGAFTLSKSDVPRIRDYTLRQTEHHSRGEIVVVWELADGFVDGE